MKLWIHHISLHTTLFISYFIYFTLQVYPRTGTRQGSRLHCPSACSDRKAKLERPPSLLDTGVPMKTTGPDRTQKLHILIWYIDFRDPTWCPSNPSAQSSMEGTAFIRRDCHHAESSRPHRDYTSGSLTSVAAETPGSRWTYSCYR